MTAEEAQQLWEELDQYRYGYVSSSNFSRWLADSADFNLPFDETHYLYNCFEANETMGRIDEAQFFNVLSGGAPAQEQEEEEEQHQPEEQNLRSAQNSSPKKSEGSPGRKWNKAMMS